MMVNRTYTKENKYVYKIICTRDVKKKKTRADPCVRTFSLSTISFYTFKLYFIKNVRLKSCVLMCV